MTIYLPKTKVQIFLRLMNALETKVKMYLHRKLCEDVKLDIINQKLVLNVDDDLPGFVKQACILIFQYTLTGEYRIEV